MNKGMWSNTIASLINYLKYAEGWEIHRLAKEHDVTAFYGCYRYVNKKFAGWIWLDDLARKHGLESYRHIKSKRDRLNDIIMSDKNLFSIYNDLSKMFHYENTKHLGLERFPSFKTAKTYFSIYTNSKVGGTKSLQRALRMMGQYVVVDGVIGKQTLDAVSNINDSDTLNKWMLYYMQRYYDALVKQNPYRFKIFAKGWKKRLYQLA